MAEITLTADEWDSLLRALDFFAAADDDDAALYERLVAINWNPPVRVSDK